VLSTLSNLEELNISECNWNEIPRSMCLSWSNMRVLKLKGCLIPSIPDEIGLLQLAELIDLRYNKINSVPESFCYLSKLKELKLKFNPLANLAITSFASSTILVGDRIKHLKDTLLDANSDDFLISENVDHLFNEALYRHYWTEFIDDRFTRGYDRGSNIEGSSWWSRPTEMRDRISKSEFCGSAGLKVRSTQYEQHGEISVIKGVYTISGTAHRYEGWNARGHSQTYEASLKILSQNLKFHSFTVDRVISTYREPR